MSSIQYGTIEKFCPHGKYFDLEVLKNFELYYAFVYNNYTVLIQNILTNKMRQENLTQNISIPPYCILPTHTLAIPQ